MLRNRSALPMLQKTYDESYLTCSTAVYYESQGNEDEAMRCWRAALDQIHDHNANKLLPNYTPRSETERALMESLRQLELQCKERIDLLQALHLSRQDIPSTQRPSSPGLPDSSEPGARAPERGWIGSGTIPAITYTQLSRPELPKRPSMPTRTSSEQAVVGSGGPLRPDARSVPSTASSAASPLATPGSEPQVSRASSPERHTMRTTLRTGKSGSRNSQPRPRPAAPKPAEGPSKAATLAWATLGLRDSALKGRIDAQASPSARLVENQAASESKGQWDSNSRRLVAPKSMATVPQSEETGRGALPAPESPMECHSQKLQSLSISAASSALGSHGIRDGSDRPSSDGERIPRLRTAPPPRLPPRVLKYEVDETRSRLEDDQSATGRSKSSSDAAPRAPGPAGHTPPLDTDRDTFVKTRRAVDATKGRERRARKGHETDEVSSSSADETIGRIDVGPSQRGRRKRQEERPIAVEGQIRAPKGALGDENDDATALDSWQKRRASILRNLPAGVDEHAAAQILNEIVVQGDEVHWGDIAGLEVAKNALREAVVYPFLRPDLFMGLREPARGMLLFGPPGTGKTMLARAVATESRSTFFSISATSLTSKYLGDSEKSVRALFALAKILAPSIIFVDEIDSLLSQRSGSGEHEATRRIKTEFLIQWSDLQRAAAGRETVGKDRSRGDANRVLVLAATNLPWAIDEAARRRFVRRQYIPLPESETRATQLATLLSQQKHSLSDADIARLVDLTDGFSGSDITALAKDAAMGPLRSVGDALLHIRMDDIRPIELPDFVTSLSTIRPSVNKEGLKAYEDWAKAFGERGG